MLAMRYIFTLLLALSALPAHAGGDKSDYVKTPPEGGAAIAPATTPADAIDPVQRFVNSNITETLYHELAHALIDKLELPIYGPEEFAADMFALVMINKMHPEAELRQITYDVAAAYRAGAVKESRADDSAMWDMHGTDEQRYYNVACMIYGAAPDIRGDIARDLDLPDERAETCAEEYEQLAWSWQGVLDQIAVDQPGSSLRVAWTLDDDSALVRFVSDETDRLNAVLALPEEVAVSVIPCDEPNAFYDPWESEIIICTELGDYLAQLAP
jgi:hypothetical protein